GLGRRVRTGPPKVGFSISSGRIVSGASVSPRVRLLFMFQPQSDRLPVSAAGVSSFTRVDRQIWRGASPDCRTGCGKPAGALGGGRLGLDLAGLSCIFQ